MYLNSLNMFRGIAILLIVAGHNYQLADLKLDTPLAAIASNLITGSSALFVFISGFLFHHIFAARFNYRRFLLGKLRNILIPYLCLALLPVFFYVDLEKADFGGYFLPQGTGWWQETVVPVVKYLANGTFLVGYWYVPFVLLTFALAPLHLRFLRLPAGWQWTLVAILGLLSMLMHRPLYQLHPWQSVLYYSPCYLAGIACSVQGNRIYAILRGKEYLMLAAAVGLAALQYRYGNGHGNYEKAALSWGGLDLMLPQKLLLCGCLLAGLQRFESRPSRSLSQLADISFAVFFLHPYALWLMDRLIGGLRLPDSWALYGVIVIVQLALSIGMALAIHRLAGPRSRYLIGWARRAPKPGRREASAHAPDSPSAQAKPSTSAMP